MGVCGVYKSDPTDPLFNGVALYYLDGKRGDLDKKLAGTRGSAIWWNGGQWRLGRGSDHWAALDAPMKVAYPPDCAVWTTKKGDGALQIVWGADPHLIVSGGDPEVCGVYKLAPPHPLYNTVGLFCKDGRRKSGDTENLVERRAVAPGVTV